MIDGKSSPPVRSTGGVGRSRVVPSRGNDVDVVDPVVSVPDDDVVVADSVVVVDEPSPAVGSPPPEHPSSTASNSRTPPSRGTAGTLPR